MPIQYNLRPNTLPAAAGTWRATVMRGELIDKEALVTRLVGRGSSLGRADLLATIDLLVGEIGIILAGGDTVDLDGVAILGTSISGTFDGPTDGFTAGRNHIELTCDAGPRIRTALAAASVEKTEADPVQPNLLEYRDANSGTLNSTLTPTGIGALAGKRLKYDPTKPDEGIWLVPTAAGMPVKAVIVPTNQPGQLIFQIPPLPAGSYFLDVRARMQNSDALKAGRLQQTLTVA